MPSATHVRTIDELKAALLAKSVEIQIVDTNLAKRIIFLKKASTPVLLSILAAAGVGIGASFTPAAPAVLAVSGIAAMTGGELATVAVISIIVCLGVSLVWSLVNGYDIDMNGEVMTPDGTKVSGGVNLKPKRSKAN
ncbi:hypothetical protein [Paucibacter sp. KCTC 42545]|uniref:hypothetical protein n=1 Tax=Paucibacter sp. KCTC 42545 TaxID=1768242 RepID=UPI000733ADD1|nr:hypothetical protein [Paucibacter sp. KCTC 42545]ALT77946.1 hypothetical protein AT984_12915 [Paucibacter sp. KCTC 42545]